MELSPVQMDALTMYMNRTALGITQKQIAQQFQVSDRQLRRWISSDEGKEFITSQAVAVAKESLNEVLAVLTKRAIEGKTPKWQELYLKVCGVLNGDVQVNVENNLVDDRSTSSVNLEIEELKKLLEETEAPPQHKYQSDRLLRLVNVADQQK
jgi:transcriptional regulator with XRE-family HTH domain